MIQSLVNETSRESEVSPFKFAVNSTIIQNKDGGKRGMNSSTGAYWNSARDGMWSYKHDGGEEMGMDVVISVIWVALDVIKA